MSWSVPSPGGQTFFPKTCKCALRMQIRQHFTILAFHCHYALKIFCSISFMGVFLPLNCCVWDIGEIRPPVTADFRMAVTIYWAWKMIQKWDLQNDARLHSAIIKSRSIFIEQFAQFYSILEEINEIIWDLTRSDTWSCTVMFAFLNKPTFPKRLWSCSCIHRLWGVSASQALQSLTWWHYGLINI